MEESTVRVQEEAEEERIEADAEVDPSQTEDPMESQARVEVPVEEPSVPLAEMDLEPAEDQEQAPEAGVAPELQLPSESMERLEMYKAMMEQGLGPFNRPSDEDSDDEDESYQPDEEDEDEGMGVPSFFHRQFRRYDEHKRLKQEGWRLVYNLLNYAPEDPDCEEHLTRIQNLMARRPEALLLSDGLRRSVLHLALLRWRSDLVKVLLSFQDDERFADLARQPFQPSDDEEKDQIPCLHLALCGVQLEHAAAPCLSCLQLLLDLPLPLVQQVDNTGRNALHVACSFGSAAAVQMLLAKGADAGLHDDHGLLPLHYAIDSRSVSCVQSILQASDQSLFPGELNPFYRCIERQAWEIALLLHKRNWNMGDEAEIDRIFCFAKERGLDKEWESVCEKGVEAASSEAASSMEEVVWNAEVFKEPGTVLVTHPTCTNHRAIPKEADDPEVRLALISRIPENPHRLEVLAGPNGVLRADQFRELRWIPEAAPAALVDVLRVHEYWYVKKLMDKIEEAKGMDSAHLAVDAGDTKVSEESWSAATRAAGAVLEAVDQVCNETARNAFCCVRPPGHHLGPAGAVDKEDLLDDPEGSQGFCLLNNVAIGAAYARCVYRHLIHKVAIIDFDVHHGNGTEAIVKNMRPRSTQAKSDSYFHAGHMMRITHLAAPTCKPWLDPESDVDNVFFASIHGFGGNFYPGTGRTAESSQPRILNVALRRNSGPVEFRQGMRHRILPALQEFGPDLIFISAGFDGHEDDLLGCCNLSEEDYVWATQQLMAIANRCCQGRVISVLEGGYNTRAEALSPFAAAVSAHVRTLMYTSQNYTFLDYEVELATIGEEQSQAEIAERFRFQRREEAKRLRRKRGWLFDDGLPPMKKAKEDDEEKVEGESEKVDKAEEKVPADEQVAADSSTVPSPQEVAADSSAVPSPQEAPETLVEAQGASPEDGSFQGNPVSNEEASSTAGPWEDSAEAAVEAPAAEAAAAEAPSLTAEEPVDTEMEREVQDSGVNSSAEDLPPAEDQQSVAEDSLAAAQDPPREQVAGEGDEEEAQLDDAERLLQETAGLLQKVGAEDLPDHEEPEEGGFEEEMENDFLDNVVQ